MDQIETKSQLDAQDVFEGLLYHSNRSDFGKAEIPVAEFFTDYSFIVRYENKALGRTPFTKIENSQQLYSFTNFYNEQGGNIEVIDCAVFSKAKPIQSKLEI